MTKCWRREGFLIPELRLLASEMGRLAIRPAFEAASKGGCGLDCPPSNGRLVRLHYQQRRSIPKKRGAVVSVDARLGDTIHSFFPRPGIYPFHCA